MQPIRHGYGAPVVGVYYEEGGKLVKLSSSVTSFKYEYDEEYDDTCIINIETDRREDPDEKWYQEKAMLHISWGYMPISEAKTLKVFIQDVKWNFSQDNIKGILTCTEKAVSMKYVGSGKVHKKVSILEVAQYMGKKHGLRAMIEIDEPFVDKVNLTPVPGETVNDYLIRRQLAQIETFDPKKHPDLGKPQNESFKIELLGDLTEFRKKMGIKVYDSIPQANRTDAQFMDAVAKREAELFPTTTEDELIIKRRNFKQKPYKSYTYGGPTGELQSFAPESKNRSRKGNSVNKEFGKWDPMVKEFSAGDANNGNANSPLLNNFIEQLKLYKLLQKYPNGKDANGKPIDGGFRAAGFTRAKNGKHIFIKNINIGKKADNTLDYTLRAGGGSVVTVNDKVKALEKAIERANDIIKEYNNHTYDPMGDDTVDAYIRAERARKNSELKKNPATAVVWGDASLKVGIIITILGVSKKYSGNYYIVKCNHEITNSGGYMVDLDMVRQGSNIKVNDGYISSKELKRPVNNQIGPDAGMPKKNLKTIMNPSFIKK